MKVFSLVLVKKKKSEQKFLWWDTTVTSALTSRSAVVSHALVYGLRCGHLYPSVVMINVPVWISWSDLLLLLLLSYPFIITEGSSVSTQAAELTKRFNGGRAMFFPVIFLETTMITDVQNNDNNHSCVVLQQAAVTRNHSSSPCEQLTSPFINAKL